MKVIDIHTHGIYGYDTRADNIDHVLKIAEIQGSFGVSEILLTIYPSPISVMRKHMEIVKEAIEKQQAIGNRQKAKSQVPMTARIRGLHLEGPFLNPLKCGALDLESFIEPTEYNLKVLIEGFENIVKIITIAPELKGATGLIKKMVCKGIIVSMGHSDATYSEAEAGFKAGARGITHIFNAMRGFHHREPGIAGFGIINKDIYIEVIADPYHLHPDTLKMIFDIKNHKRIIIVSDSVKETKMYPRDSGVRDMSGVLLGGSLTVTESTRRLIKYGYDSNVVMQCITTNPSRFLKQ